MVSGDIPRLDPPGISSSPHLTLHKRDETRQVSPQVVHYAAQYGWVL